MRAKPNRGSFKKGRISQMKGKKSIYAGILHPSYGIKRSIETKEKISNARIQNQVCSKEKNPNWKGGISSLKVLIKASIKYFKWRKDIFMRDWYTCQGCGDDTGGNLEAHHKKSFDSIMKENEIKNMEQAISCEELWDTDNGQTLCQSCHKKTDNYGRHKILISEFIPTLC